MIKDCATCFAVLPLLVTTSRPQGTAILEGTSSLSESINIIVQASHTITLFICVNYISFIKDLPQ
jgi:hypothetical protein